MKVVAILGGLGSQMFKYAFLLALKQKCNDECLIDTSYFLQKKSWNGFELKSIFGINEPDFKNLLTDNQVSRIRANQKKYIDECLSSLSKTAKTTYYYMGTKYVYNRFPLSWYRIVRQKVLLFLHLRGKHYSYSVDEVITDGNSYFDEYFHNSDEHFHFCKDVIKNAFIFPEFTDEKNSQLSTTMGKENSVAVHVRRTDHLGDNQILINNGYYRKSADHIRKNDGEGLSFYVFSEDLDWCKQHLEEIGINKDDKVEFVGWNNGENSYRDMQLMTYCKHNILAISSFSWWGYYLSNRKEKIVCAPAGYWTEVENHF